MCELTRNIRRQPRPPLGTLLVDDGRGYLLDRDYVIGREPLLDGDVAAGRAAPLPITDAEGSVSRLHLRVSLVGWRVEVRDLGSANGSVLYRAGGSRTLAPVDAVLLEPGARVGVGRRSVRFLPYDVSLPSAFRRSATPDGATA
jgi:pSer/pThr/pTyr-binding forkhead associated (FHA) protein